MRIMNRQIPTIMASDCPNDSQYQSNNVDWKTIFLIARGKSEP